MTTQQNPDREIEELTIKQLEEQREAATNIGIDVDATIKAIKGKTQQNPTLEGWEINLGELVGALMASQGHTKPLHNLELFTKYSKEIVDYVSTLITAAKEEGRQEAEIKGVTMTDQVRADIVAAAERAAYERVIEEIPIEIDFKDAEGGCPIELTVKCHIKQQLRAKFLNQGEGV